MVRDPGHRNGLTRRGAAFGQRDIEQLRGPFGIIIKQLIKVAHTIEQQDLRMLSLQLQILLHHGGVRV